MVDVEKKSFVDPIRNLTLAQIKQDQTDQSRTPTGKDVHLHCLYLDPHSKAHLTNTQVSSLDQPHGASCSSDHHGIQGL
ncbi:hypothetical protein CHARACLAT_029524 [Characodon lateralis]|uniref:Uncharacterized protein n=1 Tax=Characodon lateralis TaxID=208331 RepID=A0ABU7EE34_9TELE|nr:hypothetical protein [Characodon lateralis]